MRYNILMSVCKIITLPHPNLRKKSKPVSLPKTAGMWDKRTKKIIRDLLDTVVATKDPEGVGLSAVQINEPARIFVAKINNKFEVFINPQITHYSKKALSSGQKKSQIMEGCLSVPGYYSFIDRPIGITLKWTDEQGIKKETAFEGKQAIFLQHEYDHLNGVLFIDHTLAQKQKLYKLEKNDKGKEELREVEIG